MTTSRVRRAFAFAGVAGLAVALASAAVSGTGAYFTDSAQGAVSATMGSVVVDADGLAMHFADVLPGETRVGVATFSNGGSSTEDIWIVFDSSALAVAKQAGTVVTFQIDGSNPTTPQSGYLKDLKTQYLVHDDLAEAASGRVSVSFVVSPALDAGQGATISLPFKIVATQNGVTPDNVNKAAF